VSESQLLVQGADVICMQEQCLLILIALPLCRWFMVITQLAHIVAV